MWGYYSNYFRSNLWSIIVFYGKTCYNKIGDIMLENTKDMLEKAKNEKYAIPHFNINNLEWTRFILETCEEEKSPVILGQPGISGLSLFLVFKNLLSTPFNCI